jgi:hypothetical protein
MSVQGRKSILGASAHVSRRRAAVDTAETTISQILFETGKNVVLRIGRRKLSRRSLASALGRRHHAPALLAKKDGRRRNRSERQHPSSGCGGACGQ